MPALKDVDLDEYFATERIIADVYGRGLIDMRGAECDEAGDQATLDAQLDAIIDRHWKTDEIVDEVLGTNTVAVRARLKTEALAEIGRARSSREAMRSIMDRGGDRQREIDAAMAIMSRRSAFDLASRRLDALRRPVELMRKAELMEKGW